MPAYYKDFYHPNCSSRCRKNRCVVKLRCGHQSCHFFVDLENPNTSIEEGIAAMARHKELEHEGAVPALRREIRLSHEEIDSLKEENANMLSRVQELTALLDESVSHSADISRELKLMVTSHHASGMGSVECSVCFCVKTAIFYGCGHNLCLGCHKTRNRRHKDRGGDIDTLSCHECNKCVYEGEVGRAFMPSLQLFCR